MTRLNGEEVVLKALYGNVVSLRFPNIAGGRVLLFHRGGLARIRGLGAAPVKHDNDKIALASSELCLDYPGNASVQASGYHIVCINARGLGRYYGVPARLGFSISGFNLIALEE